MLVITLLGVVALFALLFLGRLGGGYRAELMRRWPALLLAGAAVLALLRGAWGPALGLAGLTALAWVFSPSLLAPRQGGAPPEDGADIAARAALGVGPHASETEIRRAYRAKMARAHPDRGGPHAEAAKLTAARDRLLKGKPRPL